MWKEKAMILFNSRQMVSIEAKTQISYVLLTLEDLRHDFARRDKIGRMPEIKYRVGGAD